MTAIHLYTVLMKIYHNLLLIAPIRGLLCTLLLFSVCFFCAHVIKLAKLGWTSSHSPPQEKKEDEEEKKAPAKEQEPVYYIVERKTKRAKSSYGEPKEIRFK